MYEATIFLFLFFFFVLGKLMLNKPLRSNDYIISSYSSLADMMAMYTQGSQRNLHLEIDFGSH